MEAFPTMTHALQMTIIVLLFLAAAGAFQLFAVATIFEIAQRKPARSPALASSPRTSRSSR
jgi:hypothetical protein